MELNSILLLIVGLSIALTLWRSIVVFPLKYNRGWVAVSIFVTVCIVLGLVFAPPFAGIIAGVLWLLFIVIPSSAEKIARKYVRQNRYRQAIWVSRIASLLHPFDGWWLRPRFYKGRELERSGKLSEAIQIFEEFTSHEQLAFVAITAIYTIQGQWEDYISWLEANKRDEIKRDSGVLGWYLRALGEVGDLNKMLDCFSQYRKTLEKEQSTFYTSCLIVLAFCGQNESVEKLLKLPLLSYQSDRNKLWLATAILAAGQVNEAQRLLNELQHSDDARTKNDAEKRLSDSLPIAKDVLTPESAIILQQIQSELDSNLVTYNATTPKHRFAYATLALIAINIIVFFLELAFGGSTNIDTLYQMGALWTPSILEQGQFWRLITANFLHFGFLHLLLNMYALYILGTNVEVRFGIRRYLFLYAIAGLGSMILLVFLIQSGLMQQMFAVGASGAIMGLLGVILAADFRLWRQTKSILAQNRLRNIALVILMQIVVKIVVPQVSLTLHLGGIVIGFVATMFIDSKFVNRQASLSKA